jgi:hypothetical protein
MHLSVRPFYELIIIRVALEMHAFSEYGPKDGKGGEEFHVQNYDVILIFVPKKSKRVHDLFEIKWCRKRKMSRVEASACSDSFLSPWPSLC